jgi:ABC-type dipeptide/oligopeptide/nickel transport system ATPase component
MPVNLTKQEHELVESLAAAQVKKEKVLEVKDLRISFKTDNGKVQAVRGVSFDLYKQETLCIVGESGSGKSVTSKAIMGILSANALVEGGQILYQGEDLLKVSEEEFHRIRGHKIGMIFQDPLSSLNPIVKIGKQITETLMINSNQLKNRYNDLIAKELTAYKNEKVIKNTTISQAELTYQRLCDGYEVRLKKIDDAIAFDKKGLKDLSKGKALPEGLTGTTETLNAGIKAKEAERDAVEAEYKSKAQAEKEQVKAIKAQAKADYKTHLPPLKEALKAKKAEAKVDNAAFKKKTEEDYAAQKTQIEAKRAAIHLSDADTKRLEELAGQIRKLQTKRFIAEYGLYFISKRRDKLVAKVDAELSPLLSERDQINAPYIAVDQEAKAAKDAYQEKIKITHAMAKARALEVMKEVGIPPAGETVLSVSVPVLRRHAAADCHRDRFDRGSGHLNLRRTDHRARRDHSGSDSRTHQ